MDKKPGGFLQRIARMPKAIKSAALSLPLVASLSGNAQAATDQEINQPVTPISQTASFETENTLVAEAGQKRAELLENQKLLKMSKEEYDKYFKKDGIKQSVTSNNCYALTAIDSLQHSPQMEAMARSSMKKNPDGSWDVSLPLMNDDGETTRITPKEMGRQENPKYMQPDPRFVGGKDTRKWLDPPDSPEGVRALEAAMIKKKFGTDDKGVVRRDKAEFGQADEALLELGGDNFKRTTIQGPVKYLPQYNAHGLGRLSELPQTEMRSLDQYLNSYNPQLDISTAASTYERIRTKPGEESIKKHLTQLHSYSIRDTDPNKKTVTLADPQDSSKEFTLTYDQFKDNFTTIQSVRPNHAEILKNLGSVKKGSLELRIKEDRHSKLEGIPDQSLVLKGSGKEQLIGAGSAKSTQPNPIPTSALDKGASATPTTTQATISTRTSQTTNITETQKSFASNPPLLRSAPPSPKIIGSKINTSFTLPQITIETPGDQDVHDEITQTYSQPSPSFTPARVLNRQFVSRPVGGGGGRIPSLARRSGNIMMRRLGMQAARIGAQLAAQAAIQTSRLLLNPYVLLAIGILLLILFIVAIITYTITGTGSTEEKKVSGTGGSCGPVTYKGSMNNLTDSEARAQLRAAGFGNDSIKAEVSLEGIKQNTICGIINFKNESGLNNIVITSGTDGQHSTRGTYSHINGFKLDLRINNQIDNYIRSNYRQGATRRDGAAYYIGPRGNGFYREGNHWDIAFTGSNCHNMTEGQIADPNANPNTCEQTATDQTAPENTVLSVQDCSEKWASDINSNPYKQNFGDTDCDFDQSALYTLLTELDPDQADHWFNTVIKKESGYRPNFYSKSSNGNDEKWGLFQMGNGSANPVNRGDTGWRQQVTNAVTFCRELNNKQISCACYWESWGESCNIKK